MLQWRLARSFAAVCVCCVAACGPKPIRSELHVGDAAPAVASTNATHGVHGLEPLAGAPAPDDPLVQLGKALFHDPRLSGDGTISCGSCHVVSEGGDDGRAVSTGVEGRQGSFNAPSVLNSSLNFAQFWDGRAASLSEQISGPLTNPREMDSSWATILPRLKQDAAVRRGFADAGLDGVTADNVVRAIVGFEKALVAPDSPVDRWLQGDTSALSEDARQGAALFESFGCISCHQGRNVGGNMFQRFGIAENYFEARGPINQADLGRFNVTGRQSDRFVFKVPSLRNVAETAPYLHDGSVATLADAVDVMSRYQLGREVSPRERDLLVEFLRSLSGTLDGRLLP